MKQWIATSLLSWLADFNCFDDSYILDIPPETIEVSRSVTGFSFHYFFLHCNLWPWYIHPYERTRPVNAVGDGTYFVATMKKLMQPGHPSHFQTLSFCRTNRKQSQTPKRTSSNHFHQFSISTMKSKYITTLHDVQIFMNKSKSDQILITDHFGPLWRHDGDLTKQTDSLQV